jgi:hypothetical protein
MRDPFDWAGREGRSDRPVWFVFTGVSLILIGLAASSAASYASIVFAQSTVSIAPATAISFQGTDPNGSFRPDGSLSITLRVRVDNPSARTLHLRLVAFSEWIEDGPVEAGLNQSRLNSDAMVIGANGTQYFYRVFGESKEVSEGPVPSRGNTTYTFPFLLSQSVDATRFAVLRNITDYWLSTAGSIGVGLWNFWVRLTLTIDGVLPASSPTAAPYLRTIASINREEGLNLAG